MIKLPRKFKNITHTAIVKLDDAQKDNIKVNVAKFVALNVAVVTAAVSIKYAAGQMLSDDEN